MSPASRAAKAGLRSGAVVCSSLIRATPAPQPRRCNGPFREPGEPRQLAPGGEGSGPALGRYRRALNPISRRRGATPRLGPESAVHPPMGRLSSESVQPKPPAELRRTRRCSRLALLGSSRLPAAIARRVRRLRGPDNCAGPPKEALVIQIEVCIRLGNVQDVDCPLRWVEVTRAARQSRVGQPFRQAGPD